MAFFGRPTRQDEQRAETYRAWVEKRHPFALASIVLGVFSFTHLGTLIIDGAAAIGLGVVAISQLSIGKTHHTAGTRLAIAGIALGATSLAIAVVLYSKR